VSDPVRVLRLTDVPPVRSQALFLALGHNFRPGESPDTILLVTPGQTYVSVGYHQELEREVDTEACRELGLTVVRREPGGGAVLLDSGQVFTNWVFAPRQLPAMLEDRFRLYVEPLVRTYQDRSRPPGRLDLDRCRHLGLTHPVAAARRVAACREPDRLRRR